MNLIRTVSIKLKPSREEIKFLIETISLYTKAYNFCCSEGYQNKIKNGIDLHKLTYYQTREYLPSQLCISARAKATGSLLSLNTRQKKSNKIFKCPSSKLMSIGLDCHSYTVWFDKQIVSILTTKGRIKLPFTISNYLKSYLSWKYTSADLIFKKNKFFLNIVFQKDVEDIPANGTYIGVDRGIKKLAVTSNNQFFSGGEIRRISQKHKRLRSNLQKANSKSAKRHLKKLSGQEKQFKANVNHVISRQIIDSLNPGETIVLENLCGIRNKRMRKKQRADINSWNYYQLEQFLIYKGEACGINVVYIDARYTSQRCSCCGDIKRSNRKSQSIFECRKCGFKLNADLNAARNISLKYLDATGYPDQAAVNQPIVADL